MTSFEMTSIIATTATYEQLAAVQARLEVQNWIYAKTMPYNPHHYTLRKDWDDDDSFVETVVFIREHGHDDPFGGKVYRALDLNGYHYWTMGAPLDETILINRKAIKRHTPYDAVAPNYDDWYSDEAAQQETAEIMARIAYKRGSVLDVGCGTGLFIDHHAGPKFLGNEYIGIDPSECMLRRLLEKHPSRMVFPWTLEEFAGAPLPGHKFDLIVSLFGAASYIDPVTLLRIPQMLKPGGRFFLMFYAPDYVPTTDVMAGRFLPHYGSGWKQTLGASLVYRVTRGNPYEVLEGVV